MPDFFGNGPPDGGPSGGPPGPVTSIPGTTYMRNPPAPQPGGAPQLFGIRKGGVELSIPNVDQPPTLAQDQSLAQRTQDLSLRLNTLRQAVMADQARAKNTPAFDKNILNHVMGIGRGALQYHMTPSEIKGNMGQLVEQAENQRQYRASSQGMAMGRDQVFNAADASRQAIQAWILLASKSRNWKAIGDVQSHIPSAKADTNEKLLEKIDFWLDRMKDTTGELGQRHRAPDRRAR